MATTTATTSQNVIHDILNAGKEAGLPPPRKKQRKAAGAQPTARKCEPVPPPPAKASKPEPPPPAKASKTQEPAPLKQTPLSHALSVVAAEVYLRLDEDTFKACRPAELKPKPKRIPEGGYSTWRPKGSFFFTLVKAGRDTVVYCHANNTAYHAAPAARLACDCPDQSAFLCQWCVDKDPKTGSHLPRLLVFDVLDSGGAAARGERLRSLSRCLPQPLCVVQWAGDPKVLEEFIKGGLPHPVECIVGLSDDDPLRLYRRMRVDVSRLPPVQFINMRTIN